MAYQIGLFGGNGGNFFNDGFALPTNLIAQIQVSAGSYIDKIIVTYRNGLQFQHGGGGGNLINPFVLAAGDYITVVEGTYGQYLNTLTILTKKGSSYQCGTNPGPCSFIVEVPPSPLPLPNSPAYRVTGFYGRSGSYVDAIGIWYDLI